MDFEKYSVFIVYEEKILKIIFFIREFRRKRGRSVGISSRKGKVVVSRFLRLKRVRVGNRFVKL